jgi:hypothetical protein
MLYMFFDAERPRIDLDAENSHTREESGPSTSQGKYKELGDKLL